MRYGAIFALFVALSLSGCATTMKEAATDINHGSTALDTQMRKMGFTVTTGDGMVLTPILSAHAQASLANVYGVETGMSAKEVPSALVNYGKEHGASCKLKETLSYTLTHKLATQNYLCTSGAGQSQRNFKVQVNFSSKTGKSIFVSPYEKKQSSPGMTISYGALERGLSEKYGNPQADLPVAFNAYGAIGWGWSKTLEWFFKTGYEQACIQMPKNDAFELSYIEGRLFFVPSNNDPNIGHHLNCGKMIVASIYRNNGKPSPDTEAESYAITLLDDQGITDNNAYLGRINAREKSKARKNFLEKENSAHGNF